MKLQIVGLYLLGEYARLLAMGKLVIGVLIIGLLGGGGKYLDQFFGDLAPGTESAVHSVTSSADSTLNRATTAIDQTRHPQSGPDCKSAAEPVLVEIDPGSDAAIMNHILTTIHNGAPEILHLQLQGAEERYQAAVRGLPTGPEKALSLYPFPATTEAENGIDTAYVPRGSEEVVSRQIGDALKGYCQGQAFRIVFA